MRCDDALFAPSHRIEARRAGRVSPPTLARCASLLRGDIGFGHAPRHTALNFPRMPLSILVVDDDTTIRETLVEFFDALGHVARGAATGTEGRRLVAEHAPDVVLVDLRLPDANGLTLFEALRADDPELGVIFLTGHADVPTAVDAM